MKYAVKMVLIPETEYKMLLDRNPMKAKMNKLLRGKPSREKAAEMSQLIGRHLRMQPLPKTPKAVKAPNILSHFQPIYHSKINKVMSALNKYGSDVSEKNELVLRIGDVVTNSNIIDLLKEAFVSSRRKERELPHGWRYFIQEIVNANIPLALFTKKTTREDIQNELRGWEHEWESY